MTQQREPRPGKARARYHTGPPPDTEPPPFDPDTGELDDTGSDTGPLPDETNRAPQQVVIAGRGAVSNPDDRYSAFSRSLIDDGWGSLETSLEELGDIKTTIEEEASRTILSRNQSPDIPFEQSINPYRGCEHGCIYCYARPTHAWLGLSPGRDFETHIFRKSNAVALLRRELRAPRYRVSPIAMGTNTDPYQPVERHSRITRGLLELMLECEHPVTIVTKSSLVERDADVLGALAERSLAHVSISVTTLDEELARRMEPRTAGPRQRLRAVERLSRQGIPVSVMVAPIIPGLTDHEIETIMQTARDAGARGAGYVLLRLPLEVAGLFHEWLDAWYPLRAEKVRSLVRDTRGGNDYQSEFGTRMKGTGAYAQLIASRFRKCHRRLGFGAPPPLDTSRFRPPPLSPEEEKAEQDKRRGRRGGASTAQMDLPL